MPFTATPATGELRRQYLRQMLGRIRCHRPDLARLFFAFWTAVDGYADPDSLQVNTAGSLGIMARFTLRGREFFFKYSEGSRYVPRIEDARGSPVLRVQTGRALLTSAELMQWFENESKSPVRCPVAHAPHRTSWVEGSPTAAEV